VAEVELGELLAPAEAPGRLHEGGLVGREPAGGELVDVPGADAAIEDAG
jgi:hypothetical protein